MNCVRAAAEAARGAGKIAVTAPELFEQANDAAWAAGYMLSQGDVWQAVYEWSGHDPYAPPPDETPLPLAQS